MGNVAPDLPSIESKKTCLSRQHNERDVSHVPGKLCDSVVESLFAILPPFSRGRSAAYVATGPCSNVALIPTGPPMLSRISR